MTAQVTGSIISGTLQSADLIPAFTAELKRQIGDDWEASGHADLLLDSDAMAKNPRQMTEGELTEQVNALLDALNDPDFGPPFCTFGAHEGDGADFGWWPCVSWLEDNVTDGEVLKVSDLSEVPDHWGQYVMLVNDHGNVTLYAPAREWQEVWSVV